MRDGVFHVVGDHERGQPVLLHDAVGQVEDLGRRARVEGRGMLVEQQQLWLLQGRHQKRQRLPLAAGEQADLRGHPVLETKIQRMQPLLVFGAFSLGDAPAEAAVLPAAGGKGQVLLDLHGGRGAHHRVLEHTAEEGRALMLRQAGDVGAVDDDLTAVDLEGARDGVQHGRLARAVAADDGDEIAVVESQVQIVQRGLCVDGAGVKGLAHIDEFKHGVFPPFLPCRGTSCPSSTGWPGTARRSAP